MDESASSFSAGDASYKVTVNPSQNGDGVALEKDALAPTENPVFPTDNPNRFMQFLCLFPCKLEMRKLTFGETSPEITSVVISAYAEGKIIAFFFAFSGMDNIRSWKEKKLPSEIFIMAYLLSDKVFMLVDPSVRDKAEYRPIDYYITNKIDNIPDEELAPFDSRHFSYCVFPDGLSDEERSGLYAAELRRGFTQWPYEQWVEIAQACGFLYSQKMTISEGLNPKKGVMLPENALKGNWNLTDDCRLALIASFNTVARIPCRK